MSSSRLPGFYKMKMSERLRRLADALDGQDLDGLGESATLPLANADGMIEAGQSVRRGEVTQAVRDAVGEGGPIMAGDWIAISRDGVSVVAKTAVDAAIGLVDRLADDDSELVTVLVGADAVTTDTARLEEHLALAHPQLEVEVHEGNQPLYPYLVGVE